MSKVAIAEFMAHLIISDGHIHSDQVAMLQDFIVTHDLGAHQSAIFSVLEGKGDENDPVLLEQLKNLDPADEDVLIQNAAAIVGFDRHFAKEEKDALARLCKATNIDKARIVAAVESIIAESTQARDANIVDTRKLGGFGALSLKVKKFFATGAKREYLSSKIRENQLSGPEYSSAIRLTNDIADVDCRLVEDQLAACSAVLEETTRQLRQDLSRAKPRPDATTEEKNFYDFLEGIFVSLDKQAKESIAEIKEIVDKKRRAKDAFTIALMGRTKAGKSTLHYVMTGEGKDFIGVGAERTTRFNRVYEWENLRIIDTPGIGAAEAGGRTDEEIALSVIDTADVICYVVTNDSVQEVEFEFLSKIRDSNKPVFVLLNCKENLQSPPPKYKRFIADPLFWYTRDDEHNLKGIVNRIKRGVESYYSGGSVTIIPVHLMAAKLARDDRYEKDWEVLRSGSRINEFFNEIRENVIDLGKLRKSQTLLDNTACRLSGMYKATFGSRQASLSLAKDIESKISRLSRQVKDRAEKNRASFLRDLASLVEHERSHALEFAADNYTLKQKEISRHWEQEAQRIAEDVQESLVAHMKKAGEEIQSYIAEAIDDISIAADLSFDSNFGDYHTFNTRRLTSVLGALISTGGSIAVFVLGASNPVGWVVVGLGAVVGLISGFMTSKEEKKRKAVAHMKEQVDKSLKSIRSEYEKHANKVFDEFERNMDEAIRTNLQRVANQYRASSERLEPYIDVLSGAIDRLNGQFAIRIIEFCREEALLEGLDVSQHPMVEREFGERIGILAPFDVPKHGLKRVERALKEKVVINRSAGAKV